jgi:hypothetical protein
MSDSKYALEPGLLRAFRLLMLLPLSVMLPMPILLWFGRSFGIERLVQTPVSAIQAVLPISIVVTCIYLYAPWFQQNLGHWFLPIAIALSTVGPLWVLLNELRFALDERMLDAIGVIWAAPLFLMIPITIIVWQYDFRSLVFYCLVLGGIELGYSLILGTPDALSLVESAPIFCGPDRDLFGNRLSHFPDGRSAAAATIRLGPRQPAVAPVRDHTRTTDCQPRAQPHGPRTP